MPSEIVPSQSVSQRIDKWLFHARFCRTRATAQEKARSGQVRINGQRVEKPGATVKPGDVVTLAAGRDVVVVTVLDLAARRGAAREAQALYQLIQVDA